MSYNCATHALRLGADFIDLDTSCMKNGNIVDYLNRACEKYNRQFRELGRYFAELDDYVADLKEDEWLVAFFGPFSKYSNYDPDDYVVNSLFIPGDQYHFILREDDGDWTQCDEGTDVTEADIVKELYVMETKYHCQPIFFAVHVI